MSKVMVVEDDASLREIYSIRITAEGYDVVSAGDGEEALAVAVREKPDLILSDVMMPKISGFDMLDILRSTPETANIKVIMMTALSADDQRQRGERLGANRYLVKSQVGIEDVVNTIHEVLEDSPSSNSAPSAPTDTVAMQSPAPTAAPTTPTPPPTPATPAQQIEPTAPGNFQNTPVTMNSQQPAEMAPPSSNPSDTTIYTPAAPANNTAMPSNISTQPATLPVDNSYPGAATNVAANPLVQPTANDLNQNMTANNA